MLELGEFPPKLKCVNCLHKFSSWEISIFFTQTNRRKIACGYSRRYTQTAIEIGWVEKMAQSRKVDAITTRTAYAHWAYRICIDSTNDMCGFVHLCTPNGALRCQWQRRHLVHCNALAYTCTHIQIRMLCTMHARMPRDKTVGVCIVQHHICFSTCSVNP